jgi:hypothetical protein
MRMRPGASNANQRSRPKSITALSVFFGAGTLISFTSACALIFSKSILRHIWVLNPRAYTAFHSMGMWAIVLLLTVSTLCFLACAGLWYVRRWGYQLAIGMLCGNLIGDTVNVLFGIEPRAIIGIPIVIIILIWITRPQIRASFQ